MIDMTGKVVVVVGAGKGIGAAVYNTLANQNATVYALDTEFTDELHVDAERVKAFSDDTSSIIKTVLDIAEFEGSPCTLVACCGMIGSINVLCAAIELGIGRVTSFVNVVDTYHDDAAIMSCVTESAREDASDSEIPLRVNSVTCSHTDNDLIEDVANAVLFLTSDMGSSVTGTNLKLHSVK